MKIVITIAQVKFERKQIVYSVIYKYISFCFHVLHLDLKLTTVYIHLYVYINICMNITSILIFNNT